MSEWHIDLFTITRSVLCTLLLPKSRAVTARRSRALIWGAVLFLFCFPPESALQFYFCFIFHQLPSQVA